MNKKWLPSAWSEYQQLIQERPELFRQDNRLSLVFEEDTVKEFVNRTGKMIGVVYRSPYNMMVVDLVRDSTGKLFAYERLLPTVPEGAVVTVPICDNQYVLLRQFRHSIRREQYAFPRGFGEAGYTAEENAAKELEEELGAKVLSSKFLGYVIPDSGILSGSVVVVECRIDRAKLKMNYEGIQGVEICSDELFLQWIASGKIDDSYTLSAWALLQAKRENLPPQ